MADACLHCAIIQTIVEFEKATGKQASAPDVPDVLDACMAVIGTAVAGLPVGLRATAIDFVGTRTPEFIAAAIEDADDPATVGGIH